MYVDVYVCLLSHKYRFNSSQANILFENAVLHYLEKVYLFF